MAKPKIQWHPLFGRLLRQQVGGYYELLSNVAVGDLPRQADFVLLRRTSASPGPFRGVWRYLTPWNVFEYKGPTVVARPPHLLALVEVGLGIHRRLNAEGRGPGQRSTSERDVSFWYIANRLGRNFLQVAARKLGRLEELGEGIWRGEMLEYPCLLVSGSDLPVDEDSLPLHVLGAESLAQQVAVGQFVAETAQRLDNYGFAFATLHPEAWKEVAAMAKTRRGGLTVDLRPIVEMVGLKKIIEQLGPKQIIEELGPKQVIEQVGVAAFLANLTPAQRRELQSQLKATEQ